jgi:hypothetical protein
MSDQEWAIFVGGGYGAFLFSGTEEEAEELRVHKARWEGAVALKRLATEEESASRCPSQEYATYLKGWSR